MAEGLVIDSQTEDAANVALDLVDGTNTFLLEASYPSPERDSMWASSADTEGEALIQHRYRNRVITVKIRVVGSTAANLQTQLKYCQQKVGKLAREGGTLKRTAPSTNTIVFDVLGATLDIPIDRRHLNLNKAEVTFSFECKPFGRGAPVTGSAHAESTLPVLVWTETGVGGDVPALGRLVVTESQAVDQWWLTWGVQSRYYDSATTAKLFYEAEDLTALGTAAAHAGPSGASGSGGSKVIRSGALTTTYQAIVSTQASGGGSHLSHVGAFRVYARAQTASANTGAVCIGLEWAEGDFRRYTRNAPVTFPVDSWDGSWRLVDLGQVAPSKVVTGAQQWEARIIAKSTAVGDTIDIDHIFLVPVTEGSGIATALANTATATAISARDEFDQSSGNLNGKTLPVGGTWSGAGDSDDFTIDATNHYAQRTSAVDDANPDFHLGRFAVAGTATFTNVAVQVDSKVAATGIYSGVFARYTDTDNYVAAVTYNDGWVQVVKRVSGTNSFLLGAQRGLASDYLQFQTLRLLIDAAGRWFLFQCAQGQTPQFVAGGQDSALATGGALATGKTGFINHNTSGASICQFDNFLVWVPVSDAAMFASQSAEICSTGYLREDSAGAVWTAPSVYEGDYLLVPPAGREARTSRFVVKASRGDADSLADTAIDDITATLTVTPRFLVVPEA